MNNPSPRIMGVAPPRVSLTQLDADPHGVFRHYRELTPVLEREIQGQSMGYVAIRGADIEQLASDPRTRQVEVDQLAARGVDQGPLAELWGNSMLFANGGEHRRRRAPTSRAFTIKLMDEMRPYIRTAAQRIISEHLHVGELDFLNGFASIIPTRILSEVLGIPSGALQRFSELAYGASRSLCSAFAREEIPAMQATAGKLMDYVRELLGRNSSVSNNDFLASYSQTVAEAGGLSPAETLSQIVTLIILGSYTVCGSIAMQVALLLQHREQWEAVCADPELIPGAVSEALRYEPVVASHVRFTVADIEIDGYMIPRNSLLSLSMISAMRDPELYSDPDRFNIRRTDHPRRHPAFGVGVHRCLGELLARAELEETLAAVAERLPQLELSGKAPTLHGHSCIRQIDGMRVQWASRR